MSYTIVAEFKIEPKDPKSLMDVGETIICAAKLEEWLKSSEFHVNTNRFGTIVDAPSRKRRTTVDPDAAYLSEREAIVLWHMSDGLSNKLIARAMEISEGTVKVYNKAIFAKLGVRNRTEAAKWMYENSGKLQSTKPASTPSLLSA